MGQQRMRWLYSITDLVGMNLSKLWETVEGRGVWHAAVHGVPKSQRRLRDSTTTTKSRCAREALRDQSSKHWVQKYESGFRMQYYLTYFITPLFVCVFLVKVFGEV